jgi:hypothetical protein
VSFGGKTSEEEGVFFILDEAACDKCRFDKDIRCKCNFGVSDLVGGLFERLIGLLFKVAK